MQNFISNARRRLLGAALVALMAATFAGSSTSPAFADPATVLVPRITKGSFGGLVRVKATAPEARIYSAFVAGARTPRSANCIGTTCVKTTACYDIKGASGARCISQ